MSSGPILHLPDTLDEALALLGDGAFVPLAGGTWVMRAPLRREPWADGYVAVGRVAELRVSESAPDRLRLGAARTHVEIARAAAGAPDLQALHQAAAQSANPAVRRRATVGGNLSAAGFPAPDLTTALISLDARVVVADSAGRREVPVAEHLRAGLVVEVVVPRTATCSGHARLPLRKAGDYPVAIVSAALTIGADGLVQDARIAVGAVEPVPRRWPEVEDRLVGRPADPTDAAAAAAHCAGTVVGRDGVDAPGWYRERVLPTLLARAVTSAVAANQREGAA